MRILVTRAQEDAARTAERLNALGQEVLLAPVLDIVPTGEACPRGAFDALALTSAHALGAVDPADVHDFFAADLFVVGDRGAQMARKIGFTGPIEVAVDAAALAADILRAAPRRVLYLAGRERKPGFEAALAQAGISLQVWETYDARAALMVPPAVLNALAQGQIDAVLHYSRRSAEIFRDLILAANLRAPLNELHHHCLSADVADALAQVPAIRMHIAAAATEEALFATLL
ncbi:uroporphyrinogen-III synthase [Methylovirgula sp. 4M-Z18]|uniref:uroporphyrinogen-III synthase n=1 Tax=Methylovirgula sp. 4M-Z18 TaxID=2293567 RepID=UPI000E2F4907|nr:uroporphyrinogen-III synthase [Methylovirgula sp. 4M-Z18]RFB78202.1 uroporphyrinogen-III synthase [Methylovirgula sp. 4M-Z18]